MLYIFINKRWYCVQFLPRFIIYDKRSFVSWWRSITYCNPDFVDGRKPFPRMTQKSTTFPKRRKTTKTRVKKHFHPLTIFFSSPFPIFANRTRPTTTMCRATNLPTHEDFMFLMKAITDDARQNRETPKSVRFSTYVTAAAPRQLSTDEEMTDMWYSRSELLSFKREAKRIISSSRRGLFTEDPQNTMRGLEHFSSECQRYRRTAARSTVDAHRQGFDAEQTADVSRRYSHWTGETAFIQACHDFAGVYQPTMTSLIPAVKSSPPLPPTQEDTAARNIQKRERNSITDAEIRRVRRRTQIVV